MTTEHPFLTELRRIGLYKADPARPPRVDLTGLPAAPAGDAAAARYAAKALQYETDEVAAAPEGGRNDTLNRAAFELGSLVAAGHLSAHDVIDALTDAARKAGLGITEIDRTVSRALSDGARTPRDVKLDPPRPIAAAYTIDPTTGEQAPEGALHSGQLRFAQRFAHAYIDQFLYVHGLGWHAWTGTHWREDPDGARTRAVVELLRDAWTEAGGLEGEARKALLRDITKCESANGIDGVLRIAATLTGVAASVDGIDADPELFNCVNGTLDLRTGQIRPRDPVDRITKVAGAELNPGVRSQRWERFLDEVLPDLAVRGFLQRVFGMAMLGRIEEHVLPILTGTGANGKSVLYEAVLAAFGDYGIVIDPKVIMASKHTLHGTHYLDLMGRRLVVTSETSETGRIDAAIAKRLTGGDRIRANRMHRDPFEFRPSHTLAMVTNHKPTANADDAALWRRLRVVGFDVVVPEDRRDPQLGDKLRTHDLDAVLEWCWQGWQEYRRIGLEAPDSVMQRTEEYRAEGDSLADFLDEKCVTGQYARVGATPLFREWQAWSMQNGVAAINQKTFAPMVISRGFEHKRTKTGWVYIGLGLRANDDYAGQDAFDEKG